MAPSLCGNFLTDKKSLVAFTWTITTILTLVTFVASITMMISVNTQYHGMDQYYQELYDTNQAYNNNNNNRNGEEEGSDRQEEQNNSADRQIQEYLALARMASSSMTFAALYIVIIAISLNVFGSTAIVGFTSLRGVYIGPCFSFPGTSNIKLGFFGGAIVLFANILLVCAVIFGEVRVEDWRENRDREEMEAYEVEKIATILAVTCMFLSAVYTIFAIVLLLYFGTDLLVAVEEKPMSVANDPREKFITMGESSVPPR